MCLDIDSKINLDLNTIGRVCWQTIMICCLTLGPAWMGLPTKIIFHPPSVPLCKALLLDNFWARPKLSGYRWKFVGQKNSILFDFEFWVS